MHKSSNKNERRESINTVIKNRDEVISKIHEEIALRKKYSKTARAQLLKDLKSINQNEKNHISSCELRIKQAKKACKEEVKKIKKSNPAGFSKAVNKIKFIFRNVDLSIISIFIRLEE